MSAEEHNLDAELTGLVKRSRHMQTLLLTLIDCTAHSLYDPVSDIHAVRLPGVIIRDAQQLLDSAQHPPA